MGKVIAAITTSVDGYVTGPDDGPKFGLGRGGERERFERRTGLAAAAATVDAGGQVDLGRLEVEAADHGADVAALVDRNDRRGGVGGPAGSPPAAPPGGRPGPRRSACR